jgi:hypothetical protein
VAGSIACAYWPDLSLLGLGFAQLVLVVYVAAKIVQLRGLYRGSNE